MSGVIDHKRKYLMLIPFALIFIMIALVNVLDFSVYPETTLEGTPWNRDWEMLAKVMGVETPGNGFVQLTNASVLAGDDVYYASYAIGEPTPFTNDEGKDISLYPAQLDLLLYGCADADYAAQNRDSFIAREHEVYDVQAEADETHNALPYHLLGYRCISETNPYERGAAAFAVYDKYVVVAELNCTSAFSGNEQSILGDFLDGCHFGAK